MLTNSIFTHSSRCLLFSFYFDMFCYFSGKMIGTLCMMRKQLEIEPEKFPVQYKVHKIFMVMVKTRVSRVSGNNEFFCPSIRTSSCRITCLGQTRMWAKLCTNHSVRLKTIQSRLHFNRGPDCMAFKCHYLQWCLILVSIVTV